MIIKALISILIASHLLTKLISVDSGNQDNLTVVNELDNLIIPFLEAGQDFAPISVDRTFTSNNDSPKCFPMTVNEDTIVESDETFVITLSSPDTLTDRTTTVIIHDNDGE